MKKVNRDNILKAIVIPFPDDWTEEELEIHAHTISRKTGLLVNYVCVEE